MQAGRELDAKVAETLGYQCVKYGCDEVGEYAQMISANGHSLGKVINVPQLSTTWDGMVSLMKEAAKQGVPFQIETRFMDGVLLITAACIGAKEGIVQGVGFTAPYAVCLAFLRAKGVLS